MPRIGTGDFARSVAQVAFSDPHFTVPARPALRPEVTWVEVEGGLVFDGGAEPFLVRGERAAAAFRALVPELRGRLDVPGLAAAVGLPLQVVRELVGLLVVRGLVQDGPGTRHAGLPAAVVHHLSRGAAITGAMPDAPAVARAVAEASVVVLGDPALAGPLNRSLTAADLLGEVRVVDRAHQVPEASLVVLCGSGAPTDADELSELVEKRGLPTLVAVCRGTALWCGPVLDADSAFCPACCLDALGEPPSTGRSGMTAVERQAAAGLLAGEVLHTLGRFGRNQGGTRVVRHDLRTWRSSTLDVIARPGCPRCAADAEPPDAPLIRRYEAAVSLPARQWLDPAVHRAHYRPGHLVAQLRFRAVEGAQVIGLADHALDEDGLADGPVAEWIGALLRHGVGLRRRPSPGEAPDRWAASAGNLGSTVAYCLVRDLGLPDGLYQYDPLAHQLLRLSARPEELALLWADVGSDGSLAVVVTADLGKLAAKYGLKSFRLAWLESGVALAQLRSAAGLLGVPMRAWQAWDDRLWQHVLGTSAREESVCAGALLGVPGGPR
ncbi:hypothetical protein ABZ904_26125 [Streptomyces sp. NPDC046900]|uniref:hypothetical protein n=1 Tax=Streptomyces sp. NPDC046900 TaxID=3155473 RepID=UPI0033F6D143